MSFYKREDPEPEDWTPHHPGRAAHRCRECGTVLPFGEQRFFNGWTWCAKHYREVVALAMSGQDVIDVDTFNAVRR